MKQRRIGDGLAGALIDARAPGSVTELASGLTHVQGRLWECNCTVMERDGHAVVVDACWNRADMDRVRRLVAGRKSHLLITHADSDHICGVGLLPDAEVIMGPESAERVADGSARRRTTRGPNRRVLSSAAASVRPSGVTISTR
jgi:glyoxylase-like metal-dependent hydrolase (beta-lactamase superfamily II)